MNRALAVHRTLAKRSRHRNFALPDLIIAATAELNGATVLHYDHDYDRIAEVTGQPRRVGRAARVPVARCGTSRLREIPVAADPR